MTQNRNHRPPTPPRHKKPPFRAEVDGRFRLRGLDVGQLPGLVDQAILDLFGRKLSDMLSDDEAHGFAARLQKAKAERDLLTMNTIIKELNVALHNSAFQAESAATMAQIGTLTNDNRPDWLDRPFRPLHAPKLATVST